MARRKAGPGESRTIMDDSMLDSEEISREGENTPWEIRSLLTGKARPPRVLQPRREPESGSAGGRVQKDALGFDRCIFSMNILGRYFSRRHDTMRASRGGDFKNGVEITLARECERSSPTFDQRRRRWMTQCFRNARRRPPYALLDQVFPRIRSH